MTLLTIRNNLRNKENQSEDHNLRPLSLYADVLYTSSLHYGPFIPEVQISEVIDIKALHKNGFS